jgi:hypothetical protein
MSEGPEVKLAADKLSNISKLKNSRDLFQDHLVQEFFLFIQSWHLLQTLSSPLTIFFALNTHMYFQISAMQYFMDSIE